MTVDFESNCRLSPLTRPSSELKPVLVNTCFLSKENEPPKQEWLSRNPVHLVLSIKDINSTGLHVERIQALAPNNPTILITSISGDPLLCSTLWIVSSARTVELYPNGEYAGTFRGEVLDEDSNVRPGSKDGTILAGPPLFAIKIDQESLSRNCSDLFVKFFVPKKPADFRDSLDLHWLIVQAGAVHHSTRNPQPDFFDENTMVAPNKAESGSRNPPSTMSTVASSLLSPNSHSGPVSMPDMSDLLSAFSSSVDMEKVRGMLSDMQIEGLSQKARAHMGAMETQSRLLRERTTSSLLTALPKVVAPETTFVTKTELAQTESRILSHIDTSMSSLEGRIMTRIEEGFLKMEERLLNKLMSQKEVE
ncbi:hypothetical protein EMPS_06373 [Entomortierella parvispora]|uniref:Uncharacterized protein n=1 Tax=Entomortierella parvispora TaxID=205924 RepID=A0A9P3HCI1_9FUNG|nr:hypothetical protein EMPS_06373 [Entomortierella parvispora]